MATLNLYKLNSNTTHLCGDCKKPIKGSAQALAHKTPNKKYIEQVWGTDSTAKALGKGLDSSTMTLLFHEAAKRNPPLFKDRVPKDYAVKSETTKCFFHPECIKRALASSSNCPKCETKLQAPKGLLSFKDKCVQKINQVRQAISPNCSLAALKNAVKEGYDGAVVGAQFATSTLLTRLMGLSPWEDLAELFKSDKKDPPNMNATNGSVAFALSMTYSTLLMHVIPKAEAIVESTRDKYQGALEGLEKQLAAPGVSKAEKLRLQDDIDAIKQEIKRNDNSSDFTKLRGALLTTLIGGTYFLSGIPGIVAGAALGTLVGGTFSPKQMGKVFSYLKPVEDIAIQFMEPAKKIIAALTGASLSAMLAQSAGLDNEGQVIAAGFGAGAVSSFL